MNCHRMKLLNLAFAALVLGQPSRSAAQSLTVTLNHADWLYRVGEQAEWQIKSARDTRAVVLFTFDERQMLSISDRGDLR